MQAQPLRVEDGPLLLPGRQHAAGLEGLVLAHIGLLAWRRWLTGNDQATPDRVRARDEPRVGDLVVAPPRPELHQLLTHLIRHRPRDRFDFCPRDHLDRVVPAAVDAEPDPAGRADDPLPRLRVVVMGARRAGLPDVGDLGRVDQD